MANVNNSDIDTESDTAFPALEQLLTEGGDARIAIDDKGYNKYGCGVQPDAVSLAFGSATASTISVAARSATEVVYQRLLASSQSDCSYQNYESELELVRQEFKHLCGLTISDKRPDLTDTEVVFAASGTDLHLIAVQLMTLQTPADMLERPMLVIMVEAGETGSSVPAALSGQHFSQRSALGMHVTAGESIIGAKPIVLAMVAIRDSTGTIRSLQDVDADVAALAETALAQQRQVMLVLADVSKTGMTGPSIDLAIRLQQQYPGQFSVMVDACQFRLANASLHGYLRQNFMVAVTGSKFISGPSFSGALLIPAAIRHSLGARELPVALRAYSSRADWPRDWPGAENLAKQANPGLLLRWVAALAELRAFRQVSETAIASFILQFEHVVQAYFQGQRQLTLLPTMAVDRSALQAGVSWDQLPTIFTFLLNDASGQHVLNREQTMQVYRQLQQEKQIQLGQPVTCGVRQQTEVSALRLCLSARLIVSATTGPRENACKIINDALRALDVAAELAAKLIPA